MLIIVGSASTYHRRFQEWVGKRRVFEKLWIRLLEIYDDIHGIEWEWQSLDSVSVKAPLGGGSDRSQSYR
jgi:putative transposase